MRTGPLLGMHKGTWETCHIQIGSGLRDYVDNSPTLWLISMAMRWLTCDMRSLTRSRDIDSSAWMLRKIEMWSSDRGSREKIFKHTSSWQLLTIPSCHRWRVRRWRCHCPKYRLNLNPLHPLENEVKGDRKKNDLTWPENLRTSFEKCSERINHLIHHNTATTIWRFLGMSFF